MAAAFIDALLAIPSTTTATNFYLDDSDREGSFESTAAERLDRLNDHIRATESSGIILVGEAAGWRGARQSGVPFTSASTVGLRGSKEASATAVHDLLESVGLRDQAALWNAFPLHPYKLGKPYSNRPPTSSELDDGMDALRLAIAGRRVLCVGHKSKRSVEKILGHDVPRIDGAVASSEAIVVRHPSHGGATRFGIEGFEALKIWNIA